MYALHLARRPGPPAAGPLLAAPPRPHSSQQSGSGFKQNSACNVVCASTSLHAVMLSGVLCRVVSRVVAQIL